MNAALNDLYAGQAFAEAVKRTTAIDVSLRIEATGVLGTWGGHRPGWLSSSGTREMSRALGLPLYDGAKR